MRSTEEISRLKRREREVLGLEDFTAEDIAAIEKSAPPPEAAQFNHELKS